MKFGWKIVIGLLIAFFGAAVGSVGGVGGSGIFVPMLTLIIGFDAKSFTAISQCLSFKSQELTALFLAVRLYCSFVMEQDIHTIRDSATLATTLWVIYMIRFKLKASHAQDSDNFPIIYVVIPCAILALFVHPTMGHNIVNRVLWAFCVYLEAVAVLPQLRVMQNTKIIEPFTAHYVFALGVARFFSCAHWVLQFVPMEVRLPIIGTKDTDQEKTICLLVAHIS